MRYTERAQEWPSLLSNPACGSLHETRVFVAASQADGSLNSFRKEVRKMAAPSAPVAVASPEESAGPTYSPDFLQRLIDESCCFNIFVTPSDHHAGEGCYGAERNAIGFRTVSDIRRFAMSLDISANSGVRAANLAGEITGSLLLNWRLMPHDFFALPGVHPPPTSLDRTTSQRFVMNEMGFSFGGGYDGFQSFGTGRTFPVESAGRPKLTVAAVGNITQGFGRFRGHEGTYTLCGELLAEGGFLGHVTIRVADPQHTLRDGQPLAAIGPVADPDPDGAYLFWTAQKGRGPDQANSASLTPDGKLRGLNIPTQLKRCCLDFTVHGENLRAAEYKAGEIIGREIGFGRGSYPDAPPTGTPLSPYLFEGVAQYSFFTPDGETLGSVTTNVIEGRRFDLTLPQAPGEVAWRFGFFGPIVLGTGCFHGAEGIFYGASTSVFKPPPGDHVITHQYAARLIDPDRRFRTGLTLARASKGR
jgi:hypothetical protein